MTPAKIAYWQETIRMCEKAMEPRAKKWRDLRKGLGLSYIIPGLDNPLYIARFYKILREIIASVMFRHPYVYIKAEDEPADPFSGDILENASPILQDFANDLLEIMDVRPKIQQAGFDALFCYRGWMKAVYVPKGGRLAPYSGSDTMVEDFTGIEWVRPEYMLTDPLTQPHDFYSGRFVIEKMFLSLDDILRDARNPGDRFFKAQSQLEGLLKKGTTAAATQQPFAPQEERGPDDVQNEVLLEAHRLANTRCCYEVHDRLEQTRDFFIDGIESPIEEIEHPFLAHVVETFPDPMQGKRRMLRRRPVESILKSEGIQPRKRFLVEGGFQYMTLCFDLCDEFYGPPPMEYENPIQQALTKMATRRMNILDRFKRHPVVSRGEWDANNTHIKNVLETGRDGEALILNDPVNGIKAELQWGQVPAGITELEQSLLAYEAQTIRTTTTGQQTDTATEVAVDASETELNRQYMQAPVERCYIQIVRNCFSILSDPDFEPESHELRIDSPAAARMKGLALKAWMLTGKYNCNIAAGSANILYETMQKDRALWVVQALRGSPNVDQLKMDKYIIRAGGEMDAAQLLKEGTNTDAAKAAELELQMFFAQQHDPGVTQGEDHQTHMALQNPQVIAKHPQFAQLPPPLQRVVQQMASQHEQAHRQMQEQEMSRLNVNPPGASGGGNGRAQAPAESLMSQVDSNAQKVQDTVSRQAEQGMRI